MSGKISLFDPDESSMDTFKSDRGWNWLVILKATLYSKCKLRLSFFPHFFPFRNLCASFGSFRFFFP